MLLALQTIESTAFSRYILDVEISGSNTYTLTVGAGIALLDLRYSVQYVLQAKARTRGQGAKST
jgi:hypothetical protein